ncbi:MAG: helix-turn-helix domain-containing protein [Clostridiales bacterium]|nr:helix-turn-helix domain-containing protein [Clostridiales bacterium]
MKFSEFFQELLNEFNISQAQLSRQTGIPKTTISGWLNAGRLPDYNSMRILCKFFNISGDEILQLGITDGSKIAYEEFQLIENYKKASEEVKGVIKRLLKM